MDTTHPTPVTTREATPADIDVVRRIVYEAVAWNPEESLPPLETIADHPEFARYHRAWGRTGDVGIIADVDGKPVGGAFFRLFTSEDHGHGYIDDATPEIAIAVWGAPRGQGLGTRLLGELHEAARSGGFDRLSLSVDEANPAMRLYRRAGYVHHSADGGSARMIRHL